MSWLSGLWNRCAARRQARAAARGYFEAAAVALVVVDEQGRIAGFNPKAEELFGYHRAEICGQPMEVLVPERARSAHVRHRAEFMQAARTRPLGQGVEQLARRKDGSEFPVEIGLTYLARRQGSLVVASVVDISERMRIARQMRRTEALSALGAVAAGIAHQLNNPLAIIAGRIELIMAENKPETMQPSLLEDLKAVRDSALRASRLVQDLLAFGAQRRGTLQLISINDLVKEVAALLGDQFKRDGIRIAYSLTAGLKPVRGERTALQEVLVNLLMNARDATNGNGTVTLETGWERGQPARVRLSVADDGPGIAPEAMGRLFQLFYTSKPDGTGLGLWLCRRIVQEHGGSIAAQSQPGGGARFVVVLPAAQDDREGVADGSEVSAGARVYDLAAGRQAGGRT